MSSPIDQKDMEADFAELLEALEQEEAPPEAFYLALRNALNQLEAHARHSQG